MPSEELTAKRIRVLLVEDNVDDALLLQRHLQRSGFLPEIVRVETLPEMRSVLTSSTPVDIVLADYNLPNFSGPEALRLVKESGLDLPFIMMSGAMSEETAVASMRAGAQDYVIKQNLARLAPAVERELREAQARRSRVAAERALKESEARFHRLVDAMPIGLLLSDADGTITYANEAVATLLGYSAEEFSSQAIRLEDIVCRAIDEDDASFTGWAEPVETVCVRRDGSTVDVLLGNAYLNPNDMPDSRKLATFLVDRTRQKQSEEILRRTEKLAVAGRLAASVAHEINNPLAAVTNCLFLVQGTEMTEEARGFLEMAQKELDRVAQITVQTLRFHRQASRPVESDLAELAETVLALFEPRMKRQDLFIRRKFLTSRRLLAYEGEIRQVIVNLLSNAIDASSSGGSIHLRTRLVYDHANRQEGLVLTIADQGTGIAKDALSRLFEPFYSTKGITGTGLGLWVSREIVERHQGRIAVRSKVKSASHAMGGTVFRIFLPLGGIPQPASEMSRLGLSQDASLPGQLSQ